MEITGRRTRDRTLYILVACLIIIGIALVFSTWRVLNEQRKASHEHLALTAKAVLQAVDSSLRRGMRETRTSIYAHEFFQELEANNDVVFISVTNLNSEGIRTTPGGPLLRLPPEALAELKETGRWQGPFFNHAMNLYVAAQRVESPRSGRIGHGHDAPVLQPAPPDGQTPYLVIGIDVRKYLAANAGFARTAIFQSIYILAAALLLLFLAARVLSRRELADKAVFLEHFQNRLLDTLPDGLLVLETGGRIRAANPAAEALLAAARQDTAEAMPPNETGTTPNPSPASSAPPSLVGCLLEDTPLGNAVSPSGIRGQDILRREVPCGPLRLEVLALRFKDSEDHEACMIILRDRTALSRLEKSLAEAEKMAAVGTLAAGVAHEIRNPLSSLRGFAQYFAKKFAGKQPEEEYAATMVREADRLNRVVTDMLYLSRPRALHPDTITLAPLADELEALLRFDLQAKNVTLERQFETPDLFADRENLKQALINLLLNALEAFPAEGGTDAPRITLRSGTDDDGVVWVEIADNGPGMDDTQQKQAFEPFFTTKSKGTGLGLALVHKTMREHDGSAHITTAPGKGFSIRLEFPGQSSEADAPVR
ncbi:PAS domain-containing sensor histidine kinase [Desulfovibrio sp. OttesenSCG-928-I05]|nr:PAS domain-containing sensor histidine kinase [Desulfovibrio sp. OttesenSCG-928-I05]